ncbi:hypothetical protein RJT34_30773 [Clitoria ternatea]|uniref:Uncharacterized protein n=1 Tax=Clitoria ternatea TaxID=43366 RepID=A0AAN9ETF7_CLITE
MSYKLVILPVSYLSRDSRAFFYECISFFYLPLGGTSLYAVITPVMVKQLPAIVKSFLVAAVAVAIAVVIATAVGVGVGVVEVDVADSYKGSSLPLALVDP